MAWLDLEVSILEEFASYARAERPAVAPGGARLESQRRRADKVRWAWEYAGVKRRRRERRLARAATRPPCPHCGGPVERMGATAKLPTYCSHKCMRAAIWRRYADRRAARRTA